MRSPIAKFLSEQELEALAPAPGETLLFAADDWPMTSRVLGALRLQLGRELGLIDDERLHVPLGDGLPDVRVGRGRGRWRRRAPSVHAADRRVEGHLRRATRQSARYAYDLIVNGNELGGGSFRIHEPDIQAKVFDLLALSEDEQRAKFGFLLDALAMGAPPHGGIALGIDRMTMVLAGEPNLRDVIAFPKNQAGLDPMSGAPSEITDAQLAELGLRLVAPPKGAPTDMPAALSPAAARPSRRSRCSPGSSPSR